MTFLLPPITDLHRNRWSNLGQLLQKLTVVPTAVSWTQPQSAQNHETLPVYPKDHLPFGTPTPIFAVDPRKELAGFFFQRLSWVRASQPLGLTPEAPLGVETPEIATARTFLSLQIPWAQRGGQPQAPTTQVPQGVSKLPGLLTAATQQALHTARRSKVPRPSKLRPSANSRSAETFFQSLNWQSRLIPTNV